MGFENDFALLLGRSVRNVPMKEVLLPIPTVESTNGNYQPSKYQRPIFFPPYSFIPINSLSSNYAFALATANSTRLRLFISRACDSLSLALATLYLCDSQFNPLSTFYLILSMQPSALSCVHPPLLPSRAEQLLACALTYRGAPLRSEVLPPRFDSAEAAVSCFIEVDR